MTSPSQTDETFHIGIFIHEGVEELDFCGPFEALKSAAQFRKVNDMYPNWQVFTVAEAPGILKASGELLIQPHYTFENHPKIDLLLLPGGSTNLQLERPTVIEWVRKVTQQAQINTSVCTGAFLLGEVGLLDGRKATTHWGSLDRLAERYPKTQVQREVRWVDEGPVVTAAGVSAGIDMSLHLIERLSGREMAELVAHYMEYRWNEQ